MDANRAEQIVNRLEKLEKQEVQNLFTLVEIMSNITFFGDLKKKKCEYAKEGQCCLFFLKAQAKKKIPVASDCRLAGCAGEDGHCHLELSNLTCTFCPQWQNGH